MIDIGYHLCDENQVIYCRPKHEGVCVVLKSVWKVVDHVNVKNDSQKILKLYFVNLIILMHFPVCVSVKTLLITKPML